MFYSEQLLFPSGERSNYRIPSVITTNNGTVLAFCNDRKDSYKDEATSMALVYAKKCPNQPWSQPVALMEHEGLVCMLGSAVHDTQTDTTFVFVNCKFARHEFGKRTPEELKELEKDDARRASELGIELGDFQLASADNGETWSCEKMSSEPFVFTHIDGSTVVAGPFPHGCSHGIQLKHGKYAGRLLCPSRIFAGTYESLADIRNYVYNNAIYSDDHGQTWKTSAPVQLGTGEGTLIETGNGSILYNSRAYFADGKRYLATSTDGGETYSDFRTDAFLEEEKRMGCNASFLRVDRDELGEALAQKYLPEGSDAITVFVNPRAETRRNMTACVSFDDGQSWRIAKTFYEEACAYSSLAFSEVDKHFHLIYEKGIGKPYTLGISAVEFDLEWLLS